MIFLPVTLTLIPPRITTLVLILILSRGELQVSAGDNSDVDGRFFFEDSNCPQSWKRELELEPELERPSLELWHDNGTKIFDGPSPKILVMAKEYQEDNSVTIKMMCKAPYPVIQLAAFELNLVGRQDDVFDVTTTNIYNRSSYNFETGTRFSLPSGALFKDYFGWKKSRNNIFYCQAVHNPCLKSREKLLYFHDSTAQIMSLSFRYYSFASGSNSFSDLSFDSDSNSTLNTNSSSISPLEIKSLFGTSLNWNLNFKDQDQNHNNENNTSDSECEAFFYYEVVQDEPDIFTESRSSLMYRCEFSDGTPGTVQVSRRCNNWGRCRFLVAARKQKAKNCWRPYIAGKTCLNCTAQFLQLFYTEPAIPHCITSGGGNEADQVDERKATEEDNHPLDADAMKETGTDDEFENDGATHENTGPFEAESKTEANTEQPGRLDVNNDNNHNADEHKSPTLMHRSVKGTPLYIGFPPPGFQIQRPFIRTDLYDQDELGEAALVQIKPFPEIQLFNTRLQITCDSNEWYTSNVGAFALEFEPEGGKGKGVPRNLQFFPVEKTSLQPRYLSSNGNLNRQTLTLHLNRTDITRIFCFAGVQNSYQWINASRPIRVLEYPDFYKPSECLDETEKNSEKPRPKLSVSFTSGDTVEFDEEHPQLLLDDDDNPTLTCSAYYPIQVLSTFNDTMGPGKVADQFTGYNFIQNRPIDYFELQGFKFEPKIESHFYRCQSLENPCLHRSIFYSYVPGPPRQFKFEHVPQNDKDSSKSNALLGLEFGSPANYTECEVIFFYKELEDFTGYEFRCEFPLKEEGKVKFHSCDSLNDCGNLYRNRRQSKRCWKKVKTWRDCQFCQESRPAGVRPFVATCKTGDGKESAFGNFAAFGLKNQENEIAPIYFSNEDIDATKMLILEPFEKYQLLNASLNVTCAASAYYMSYKNFYIAKGYAGRNELKTIDSGELYTTKFKWKPDQHEWRLTRNVELGNDPELTHLFCIGTTWLNYGRRIDSSRPIHLQGPKAPKIILDAGDFEETLTTLLLHGPRNSQMSSVEQEYEFLVNSENQTLVCQSGGYPPPKIQWLTTAPNAPEPSETIVNSSHSLSWIFLPLVDAGVKGIYFCTAMNSQGNATASMKIDLKYPVNKSMVAIVTSSLLIFASLSIIMALLWRRIRGLKKILRDLTPEEVEEFHLGSKTVDPDDPLAQVHARPYDRALEVPRELIELDEDAILGSGQFGLVQSGYIKIRQDVPGGNEKMLVAVKQARPKLRAELFKNMLSEIKVMSHLRQHENVLQILAACTTTITKCQVLIVMEFCERGDLHKYLRGQNEKCTFEDIFDPRSDGYDGVSALTTEGEKFSTHNLIDFSLGIANGMKYLREKEVVHGDLAARNVLLTKTMQVKISDFGYSTHLINSASYTKYELAVIPWRWFSIEALKERKLSFKSDVWAFGVLLYELFTLGELPYSEVDKKSAEFIQDLTNGKRLEQPEYTNDEIYAVMTDCWQKEPSERPTFQQIYDRLLDIKKELNKE